MTRTAVKDALWELWATLSVLLIATGVFGFIWQTDAHNWLWVRVTLTGLVSSVMCVSLKLATSE